MCAAETNSARPQKTLNPGHQVQPRVPHPSKGPRHIPPPVLSPGRLLAPPVRTSNVATPRYTVHTFKDQLQHLQQVQQLEETFREQLSIPGAVHQDVHQPNHQLLYALHTTTQQVAGYCVVAGGGLAAHLVKLVVDPAHRRTGVGTRLVQEVCTQARVSRSCCISLYVSPGNTPALALYSRLGFKQDALLEDYYGPGKPASRMMKDLEGGQQPV